MQTTIKIKLVPNKAQKKLIEMTLSEYISSVNNIVSDFAILDNIDKRTTKDVDAYMPSTLINQSISDAKSIFKKYKKACKKADSWNKKHKEKQPKTVTLPVLRKPVAIWNNQNYKVSEAAVSFPVFVDGKSQRLKVKALIPNETLERIQNNKLGTFRISVKNNKLIGQIAIETNIQELNVHGTMSVDLGLKIPAVCVTDSDKVKFVGNGRKNKYIKRYFRSKRKELGKTKKVNAIKKNQNKEQRIMKDIDHKASREIVNFAKDNNIALINLENLANIRKTARTSRKNRKNLHTWSFYRLAQYIEYKANLLGIEVKYVDPAYTSQICPMCGTKNHAKDRKYTCNCGFHGHRDIVGAINIRNIVPVTDGQSLSA